MRIITIVLLGLLCSIYSFSQSINYSSLKPVEIVAESKSAGSPFEETFLFHPSEKKKSLADKDVLDYNTFVLDVEALQKVVFTAPQSLTLDIPRQQKKALQLELVQVNPFDGNFLQLLWDFGKFLPKIRSVFNNHSFSKRSERESSCFVVPRLFSCSAQPTAS